MHSSAHGELWGGGCLLEVSVTLKRFGRCHYLLQRGCVHVSVSVCWLVWLQDCSKTTEQIHMKLEQRMDHSQEYYPFTFGADPDKGMDPGISTFFCIARKSIFSRPPSPPCRRYALYWDVNKSCGTRTRLLGCSPVHCPDLCTISPNIAVFGCICLLHNLKVLF